MDEDEIQDTYGAYSFDPKPGEHPRSSEELNDIVRAAIIQYRGYPVDEIPGMVAAHLDVNDHDTLLWMVVQGVNAILTPMVESGQIGRDDD